MVRALLRESQQPSRFLSDYAITLTQLLASHAIDSLAQEEDVFPWTEWLAILHSVFVPLESQRQVATLIGRVLVLYGERLE